jgi:large subunit ribosomal protein L29
MQFAHAMTPIENPMSLRELRKDIARMQTELKKREVGV